MSAPPAPAVKVPSQVTDLSTDNSFATAARSSPSPPPPQPESPVVEKSADAVESVPSPPNPTTSITPEGKDYVVDFSNKEFPCVVRAGRKLTSIGGDVFNLPQRFSITSNLGVGTYCTVVGAKDENSGEEVAIKKCSYVFARNEDGKRLLREVKLGTGLQHQNILSLRDILVPLECEFNDLYFISEKMDTDLYRYQRNRGLPEVHIQPILYQVVRGLKYIHSAHVLHRDLKPDNILLRLADGVVKICDFNLSRGFDPTPTSTNEPMTANVATRWYRSPELLVDNRRYSSAVDIWSLGCILAEMATGKTLFPGDTQVDMLDRILKALDVDASTNISWIESAEMREQVQRMIDAKVASGIRSTLSDLLPTTLSPTAVKLLERMLKFVPSERCTVDDVLTDPYLSEFFSPQASNQSERVFKWKWDDLKPSDATLRHLFWREIVKMHPEVQQQKSSA